MKKERRKWAVPKDVFCVRVSVPVAEKIRKLAAIREMSPNQLIAEVLRQHIASN